MDKQDPREVYVANIAASVIGDPSIANSIIASPGGELKSFLNVNECPSL
jgi:hypothetical protein